MTTRPTRRPAPPPAPPTAEAQPRLHHAGRIRPVPRWGLPRHAHAAMHELIVVLAGQLQTQIRGLTLTGGPGAVLLYPRGEAHAEAATGPVLLQTVFLGWSWLGHDSVADWPLKVDDERGRIRMLAEWLDESPLAGAGSTAVRGGLLGGVLEEYQRLGAARESPLVRRVREYVHAHLAEPICLDDLAAAAALSRYHFARLFAAATGRPPMRFVAECRVAAARTHLSAGPAPLRHVARLVGLGDEFQLSRVFKRITGVPPGSLRG